MKPDNVLSAKNRNELRQWLEHNHLTEKECWVAVKRGRPTSDDVFWYVDAVEEALCFGWIDSTTKTLQDGVTYQKLAPRKKGSLWSELNKERCRRMDKLGMMTEYGRAVLPDMTPAGFVIDDDILAALQTDDVVWSNFQSFPELYQRVRMVGTGLRVGEVTGLRWCDIDLDEGVIDVNHTLVYYEHRSDEGKRGCYFNVNTPKTPTSNRQVPMLDFVKEAFLIEKKNQELLDLHCQVTIDGYSDFIFINRFGQAQHQGTLNKALRRIIRDCNDEQLLKDENTDLLLPHFSCHSLRHTFTTRMCEAGVNVKVIQDTLGHKDISTTLNIYTDVTKELKRSEFEGLDLYFKAE